MDTPNTHVKSWWLDLLIITLLCTGLFSLFLGAYPLIDPDEGRYSDVTRHMILSGNFLVPMVNGIPFFDKPILFYWLQSIPVMIAGVINEWTLRIWPMMAATITCLLTYVTGRQCFNRRTGWLASLILATSGLFFLMAHFANLDLTVAMFISLALFSFMLAMENKTRRRNYLLWLAYLFAGLAILTKGLIGIVFPMIIIGLWILLLNHWKLIKNMRLISGLLLIAVIVTPWFIAIQHKFPDFLHYFIYIQQVQRFFSHQFNDHENIFFYPELILLGIFPWTVFFIVALVNKINLCWRQRLRQKKHLFLLVWIISITLFFSIPTSKTAGYILPVFPAIALLTASYLSRSTQHHSIAANLSTLLTAILLLIMAIALPIIVHFNHHLTPVRHELYVASIVLAGSSIVLFTFFIQKKLLHAIVTTGITAACLLSILMFAMAYHSTNLGIRTSKPLAMKLKPYLKPNDVVVFYHFYYQDLPIYLDRQIILVEKSASKTNQDNWKHDFYEGLKYTKYRHLMLNDTQFTKLWNSSTTVYAFTIQSQLTDLEKNIHYKFHVIGHYAKLILISNHNHSTLRLLYKNNKN